MPTEETITKLIPWPYSNLLITIGYSMNILSKLSFRAPIIGLCLGVLPLLLSACNTTGSKDIVPTAQALEYKPTRNLVQYDKKQQALIHVALYEDERPEIEMTGDAPEGFNVGLASSKKGTYITGDSIWTEGSGASTPKKFSQVTAEVLRDSGLFNQVFENDSSAPKVDEGLVLKCRIKSFYGSQEFDAGSVFVGVYRHKHRKVKPPQGVCIIEYKLLDAESGTTLKSNTITAKTSDKRATISEIGQDALNQAVVNLVNEITTRALLEY